MKNRLTKFVSIAVVLSVVVPAYSGFIFVSKAKSEVLGSIKLSTACAAASSPTPTPVHTNPTPAPEEPTIKFQNVHIDKSVKTKNNKHPNVAYINGNHPLAGTIENTYGTLSISVNVTDVDSKALKRSFSYSSFRSKKSTIDLAELTDLQSYLSLGRLSVGRYKLELSVKKNTEPTVSMTIKFSILSQGACLLSTRLYSELLKESVNPCAYDYAYSLSKKTLTACTLVRRFTNSREFAEKNLSNGAFVNRLYGAILGRPADRDGYNYWVQCLEKGASRPWVVNAFLESKEFVDLCEAWLILRGT